MARILIADDEKQFAFLLQKRLQEKGHEIVLAHTGLEALSLAQREYFDVAILDICMPKRTGLDALREIKQAAPEIDCFLMTAFASTETAIEALRHHAEDYLIKPFAFEELDIRLDRILRKRGLIKEKILYDRSKEHFDGFIGENPTILKIRKLAAKVAEVNSPVLLLGETGAGKEVLAQYIHQLSPRKSKSFVAINCVALAENLLESELFGHEKGSFTGAIAQKQGLLELANGGTVFLDEIGEISPKIQVKLLRFLQEKEIQHVGGTKIIRVDARIIAATNRNLKEEVKCNRFREDLFYRLNVFEIILPPLRERRDDLMPLIHYFFEKHQKRLHKRARLMPETVAALQGYTWPGNIRELENVIERAVILAEGGEVQLDDLPPRIALSDEPETKNLKIATNGGDKKTQKDQIRQVEREIIKRALDENAWNQVRVAKKLGIKRSTLQYRMNKYDLKKPATDSTS